MEDLGAKVQSLLGTDRPCRCGRRHVIGTRVVETGPGAIAALPSVLNRLGLAGPAVVMSDPQTQAAAGTRVEAVLSPAGFEYARRVLHPARGRGLHAEERTVAGVEKLIDSATSLCIAVGSGTINDLVKLASFRRNVPYVVVATAASMNGYTSAIAAVEAGGIKRTVECREPVAVVGDTDVILAAPHAMTAAGVGDLMSKPVCNADWLLSHLVREDYFCDEPLSIAGPAAEAVANNASAVGSGDPAAIENLFHALLLSGFSMKVAGSSAPASGGEHLISHYWDMRAPERGRETGLHGAQVGVATLLTAALYRVLKDGWHELVAGAACEESVHGEHGGDAQFRDFYGPLSGEVTKEFRKKFPSEEACRADLASVRRHEKEIHDRVFAGLRDPDEIRAVLSAAGAPVTVEALGIGAAEALEAIGHAREIRGRYTVLDLAAELSVLPGRAAEILKLAKVV
ncbi:MAG: sn-glycerol-1-phosphate dehydrogenase [Deltaproteobacteria bacterium]|nr:sn-glycerol-1-phosphate dehydrogenase [Deltaproteobacteria bacterium]